MQLEHSFTVPVGIDEAWGILLDIERVGPCMPGAAIETVDGDDFTGTVKVKLGPINLTYKGKASFTEKDEAAHRAVIDARGKDSRGNGTAAAKVTATLTDDGDNTKVLVGTDLDITGKPAQFGRGVMQDVSDRLLGQFATCLETKLGPAADPEQQPPAEPEAALTQKSAAKEAPAKTATAKKAPAKKAAARKAAAVKKSPAARTPAEQAAAAEPRATSEAPAPGPPTTATAAHRREPEPVALNLGTAVIPVLARRYAPYLVGGFVGLVLLWRLVRRRR